MGKGIVATAQVSDISALVDQLTKLQFGELSYSLLQRSDAITDWKIGAPGTTEIEAYTHGRLFGNNGEIRWKKTVEGYSLLWLSEGDLPEGFTALGEWETSAPQEVFLLGGGDSTTWQDTRISRELNYPINRCQFPSVKIIEYKELNSQTIRFTRYTDFVDK